MYMVIILNIVNFNIDFESFDIVFFWFGCRFDYFIEVFFNVCFWYYCYKYKFLEIFGKSKICYFFIFYGIIVNLV